MKQQQATMETSLDDPQFLTAADLCIRWAHAVTLATLATWRSRSLGPPYVKIGGRVMYRSADVKAWEAKNTRGSK